MQQEGIADDSNAHEMLYIKCAAKCVNHCWTVYLSKSYCGSSGREEFAAPVRTCSSKDSYVMSLNTQQETELGNS